MTIKDLKEIIKDIPDDFIFEVEVQRALSEDEIDKLLYPYPYVSERCDTDKSSYDIGWSEGKVKINIEISYDLLK